MFQLPRVDNHHDLTPKKSACPQQLETWLRDALLQTLNDTDKKSKCVKMDDENQPQIVVETTSECVKVHCMLQKYFKRGSENEHGIKIIVRALNGLSCPCVEFTPDEWDRALEKDEELQQKNYVQYEIDSPTAGLMDVAMKLDIKMIKEMGVSKAAEYVIGIFKLCHKTGQLLSDKSGDTFVKEFRSAISQCKGINSENSF